MTIAPQTLAWLRQTAKFDGAAYSQVLLHLLERVEALEQQPTCKQALQVPPTPEAAPLVTDEELLAMRSWSSHGPTFDSDLVEFGRACYNLGRQHGAAQPPAAQPASPVAPAGGLVERVANAIGDGSFGNWLPEARAAIREVAAWMQDHEHAFNAAYWLELEVGQ